MRGFIINFKTANFLVVFFICNEMDYTEYKTKMEKLDVETKDKFNEVFKTSYHIFAKMNYSKIELFAELLKRTAKKDSICLAQLWQGNEPNI